MATRKEVMAKAAERRERAVRMAATMTMKEIGKRMGISQQRVHQLIKKQRAMAGAIALLAAWPAWAYEVCVQTRANDAIVESACYNSDEVTGWRLCGDFQTEVYPNVGPIRDEYLLPGRFIAFDSDDVTCPPLGCVVTQGRFDFKAVDRDDIGIALRTLLVADSAETADGFEPMDLYATSTCVFTRFGVPVR